MTIAGYSEWVVRLAAFVGVLALMIALERMRPRRKLTLARVKRWTTNLAIVGLGSLAVRLLAFISEFIALPLIAVLAAVYAGQHGIGFFHWLAIPQWVAFLIAVLALDFAVWLQHYISHVWQPLWRLHRVHHADRDIDATTALRFHPVEILLSMIYKVAWVLALGAPVAAVIVFEIVLNASAMFNHANWRMPLALDRILRPLVVTPDMHRVHHSVYRNEHNTNFGFCLSIWDRTFGTYTAQPKDGHEGMRIGLEPFQTEKPADLGWSLALPFRSTPLRESEKKTGKQT